MTPHTSSSERGSFIVDRIFPGVGRLRRHSGTKSPRTFKAINRMLDECYEAGALSALKAMKEGTLKLVVAYDAFRRGGVKAIPDAPAMRELAAAWTEWQTKTPNASTKRDRGNAWRRLVGLLPKSATLADLPPAVMVARGELEAHAPAFNRLRSAALAFLRDTVGRRHASYLEVTGVPGLQEVVVRRAAPTPEQAIHTRDALAGNAKALWWTMVTTGMGPKEIDGQWVASGDRVSIPGTKRKSRVRVVPNLDGTVRRGLGWKQFATALRPFGWQPYDTRRAFAHLLEEAGVPRTRRKQYLGHAAGDVTGGYETAELSEYLVADRARVLARLTLAEERNATGRREGLKRA